MAWVDASEYRPVEPGWYWVQMPHAEEAIITEWKWSDYLSAHAWWFAGSPVLTYSLAYPIRYWDKPIRQRKLPRERKMVRKVKLAELREEPTL